MYFEKAGAICLVSSKPFVDVFSFDALVGNWMSINWCVIYDILKIELYANRISNMANSTIIEYVNSLYSITNWWCVDPVNTGITQPREYLDTYKQPREHRDYLALWVPGYLQTTLWIPGLLSLVSTWILTSNPVNTGIT